MKQFKITYEVKFDLPHDKEVKRKGNRIVEATSVEAAKVMIDEAWFDTDERRFIKDPPKSYYGANFDIIKVEEVKEVKVKKVDKWPEVKSTYTRSEVRALVARAVEFGLHYGNKNVLKSFIIASFLEANRLKEF